METIKMLHTSDVHIGAPFQFLGGKGGEQRLALREALARITLIAREDGYHLLVIAGDLFDSAYDATDADVSFVIGCLQEAGSSCRVVILPGGHDHFSPGSVYERELKRFEAGGNVHILAPDRPVIEFSDLSLAVHGKALTTNVASVSGLAGLAPLAGLRWNVCLAHCSVEGFSAGLDENEARSRLEDLEPGFDYVGLGHWHSCRVLRENAPPVIYSGSPELVARDQQGSGFAVSVELSAAGIAFERRAIGIRRRESRSIDCTGLGSTEEFVQRVLKEAPPDRNLILELQLGGLIGVDSALDPGQGSAELERRYFSVRFAGKGPSREISREELLAMPAETVAGAFVRSMLARIDGSEGETRELYEEALQLGVQLFKGRDMIA